MPFIKHEKPGDGWIKKSCGHPEHNPPPMIVLPPGTHTYECPKCKERQIVIVREVTLQAGRTFAP